MFSFPPQTFAGTSSVRGAEEQWGRPKVSDTFGGCQRGVRRDGDGRKARYVFYWWDSPSREVERGSTAAFLRSPLFPVDGGAANGGGSGSAPRDSNKYSSDSDGSSDEDGEDSREMTGRTYSKAGIEVREPPARRHK